MAQEPFRAADLGGMFAPVAARAAQKQESAGRLERAAAGLPLRTSFLVIVVVLGVALGGSFLRSAFRDEVAATDTHKLTALCRQVRTVRERLEHLDLLDQLEVG